MTSRTGNFIRRPLALAGAATVALLSITGVTLVGPGVLAGESRSAPLPVAMPSASSAVPAPPPANIEPAPDPEPSITVAVAKPRPASSKAAGRRPTRAVKKPSTPKLVSATTVPYLDGAFVKDAFTVLPSS